MTHPRAIEHEGAALKLPQLAGEAGVASLRLQPAFPAWDAYDCQG